MKMLRILPLPLSVVLTAFAALMILVDTSHSADDGMTDSFKSLAFRWQALRAVQFVQAYQENPSIRDQLTSRNQQRFDNLGIPNAILLTSSDLSKVQNIDQIECVAGKSAYPANKEITRWESSCTIWINDHERLEIQFRLTNDHFRKMETFLLKPLALIISN